jgi:FkbM family methyltransferase
MPASSAEQVTLSPSGWWLPKADSYFAQFVPGLPPKRNGFQREHLLEAVKHVRHRRIAVDVGSHVGFWAFDMAQWFNEVFAFEASPCNYACLVKNIAEFPNVRAYNMAVGDQPGWCKVFGDDKRQGNTGSFYVRPFQQGDVQMITLDDQNLPGCDLLKVDVEGFELRVLEGARKLIKAYRPVIIMECSDAKFKDRYGIPEGEAQRWLLKRGYQEVASMRPDKVFVAAT